MTVPSQTPKVSYTANGATKSFPFSFRILKTNHLAVFVGLVPQTLGTHYSVTSTNLAAGGSVVFVNAPANGEKVKIYRNMPYSRTDFDYQTSGSFTAATINEDLDSLALQVQQLAEVVDRSMTIGRFTDGVSTALPTPSSLKALRWNAAANALENYEPSSGSNTVSVPVTRVERQTAADGQTVFNLTNTYLPGVNSIQVECDGAVFVSGDNYAETSASIVTLVEPAIAGQTFVFKTNSFVNSPASDSASVAYIPAGSGAVPRNVQSKLRDTVSVFDFGAVDGGDISTALDSAYAALPSTGGAIYVPAGSYTISKKFTTTDTKPVFLHGDGYASKITKAFNGDMIDLCAQSTISDLYLEGAYASYTGRGVIISSGSLGMSSWRHLSRVYILGTASYGVEFTAGSAGYGTRIEDSFIVPGNMLTASSVASVKMPSEAANGNRSMINVFCYGQPIVDCSGTDNATIIGCTGRYPIMSSSSKKIIMHGNRIVGDGGTWTIDGTDCNITGNAIAPMPITFSATCAKLLFKNTYGSGTTFTDSANGLTDGNSISIDSTNYTPTWVGGSPAIGNGTLTGNYTRNGQKIEINVRMTAGTTTTFGSGAWTFSVPYTAVRSAAGSAWIFDSSANAYYMATCFIGAGENTVKVITSTSTSTWVGSAHPMAWATSDEIRIDIDYVI